MYITWFALLIAWWRHQMETFSALLVLCAGNSPVPGEVSSQRPVTRSFHVFFDLRLNKRLSKQSWGRWFETPSPPLWRHRNGNAKKSRYITPNRYEIALTDEKSTLVQLMVWCRLKTSDFLTMLVEWSLSPYDVTRRQRIKLGDVLFLVCSCEIKYAIEKNGWFDE